jgi:peroxiredoxin
LKKYKILSYAAEFLILILIVWGVSKWQGTNLVGQNEAAPEFSLKTVSGLDISSESLKGKKTVLYFFTPWCSVCRLSSGNITALKNSGKDINIIAIALSWEKPEDVFNFIREHKLDVPVILGDDRIGGKYKIEAFPTIYILDEKGRILNSLVGYTTEIGLNLRLL